MQEHANCVVRSPKPGNQEWEIRYPDEEARCYTRKKVLRRNPPHKRQGRVTLEVEEAQDKEAVRVVASRAPARVEKHREEGDNLEETRGSQRMNRIGM